MKICFKNTAKPYQNQKKVKYEQVYPTYYAYLEQLRWHWHITLYIGSRLELA